jgi:hypothetical protein
MIKAMEPEMVSRRRMFSFVGLAVASGLAFRPTDAEAQTSGMERRHERRGGRVERRYERRGGTPASKQPATDTPAGAQPAPTQKQ